MILENATFGCKSRSVCPHLGLWGCSPSQEPPFLYPALPCPHFCMTERDHTLPFPAISYQFHLCTNMVKYWARNKHGLSRIGLSFLSFIFKGLLFHSMCKTPLKHPSKDKNYFTKPLQQVSEIETFLTLIYRMFSEA